MTSDGRKLWRSPKGKADKIIANRVIGWDIDTGDMNDFVSASFIDNTVVNLGSGNDVLNVVSVGNVTIDGGTGADTVSFLGYRQSEFDFVYLQGSEWSLHVLSSYDRGAVVSNIETIHFKDGITATLKAGGTTPASITFSGTKNSDSFWLPINSEYPSESLPAATIINAGAGNDTIFVPMSGSGVPAKNIVDGGTGTDTLFFWGLPQMYGFEKSSRGWQVLDFAGRLLFEAVSIEHAEFSDGTRVDFGNNGIELTGGSFRLQVSGSAGNDTIHGTSEADIFWTTAGTDTYDLRKGGADAIYLDPAAYGSGTVTTMTVQGFLNNDKLAFFTNSNGSILDDNTRYVNGIRSGDLTVVWSNAVQTMTLITFTA